MNWKIQSKNNLEPFYGSHRCIQRAKIKSSWSSVASTLVVLSMVVHVNADLQLRAKVLTRRGPCECPRSSLRPPQWVCRILAQGRTPQTTVWSPGKKRHQENKINCCLKDLLLHFCIRNLHLSAKDLLGSTPRQCPCIDLHCMLKSFEEKNKSAAALHPPKGAQMACGSNVDCSLWTACCCWALRDWVFNAWLAGTFTAVAACKRHSVVNLPSALKCHNTSILLFAACTLFISSRSCWRRGVRWETFFFFVVFSNPLRGGSRPQSQRFWAYKRSKMNHDLQYCTQESITRQITLQKAEKKTHRRW